MGGDDIMKLNINLINICLALVLFVGPIYLNVNAVRAIPNQTNFPSFTYSQKTYLNILVDDVLLTGAPGEIDGIAEAQMVIVATDGNIYSHTSYCPSPPQTMHLRQGGHERTKCASLGFEPEKLTSPLVITFMLIDLDEGGLPTEIGSILSGSALTYVAGAVVGVASWTGPVGIVGGIVFDAIISSLPGRFIKYFEKEDTLGEQTILVERNSNWKPNQIYKIKSNNGAVTFNVQIDQTYSAPDQLVPAEQKKPSNSTNPPAGNNSISENNAPSSPNSSVASTGDLIAFVSTRNGSKDIFVMNSNGKNITPITGLDKDEQTPTWSPDGKKIAFYSPKDGDQEIYIVEIDSRQIRQITNNKCADFGPAWSPKGQKIAFYSDCDGNREIYTMNTDGSNRKQLTFTNKTYNWFPTWSPDGSSITYSSNVSGKYFIYVMSADGSNNIQLNTGCISAFSPDGKKIVYAQYCTDYGDIYIMKSNGGNAHAITSNGANRNPTWSSDGTKIIYQSNANGSNDIWVMDPNGQNQKPLTSGNASDTEPIWQP
jgi:hypothetical protein